MMLQYKFWIDRLTLMSLLIMLNICSSPSQADEPPIQVELDAYLYDVGQKLDCYFTLEMATVNSRNALWSRVVARPVPANSIQELVQNLHTIFPDVDIEWDKENPVIVHLADKSLKSIKHYVLNESNELHQVLTLGMLPGQLNRSTRAEFSIISGYDSERILVSDTRTMISVAADNKPIREILSDYLPLSQYRRILWETTTATSNNKVKTEILYHGYSKNFRKNKQKIDADFPLIFTEGEEAYALNPADEKTSQDASKFITDGFKKGKTLNVRWAMLYLGKYKVERSLPLLMQHLDYAYTTCPVLDEAYPALHALLDMGKPAASAAFRALPTETNPLRLKLLCAALMGINGNYEGRKQARELAERLPEEQKARIVSALSGVDERLIAVPPPWDGKAESPKEH